MNYHSRSTRLYRQLARISVDFLNFAVQLFQLLRVTVLFVTKVHLFLASTINWTQYFYVLIPLFRLLQSRRVVKTHHHHWNVIGWPSVHRFKQNSLGTFTIPVFILTFFLKHSLRNLHYFCVIEFVPYPIWSQHYKIVIIDFKAADLRLINDNFWAFLSLFSLVITKSSCRRQSSRKNSQGSSETVIEAIRFCDSCCLVNFSSSFKDSLLLIRVGRFMVLCNLIALVKLLTHQNCPWVTQISSVANIFVNENNYCTTTWVVAFFLPFVFSHKESLP